MNDGDINIFPLGDSALTVEFGRTISNTLNKKAIALAHLFDRNPFAGFIESVPTYSSTTVFYDPAVVRRNFSNAPSAFEAVRRMALAALSTSGESNGEPSRTLEIPVDFGEAAALDLTFVAKTTGLAPDEVVEIFIGRTYRVFMIGFLPGFPYMGEVDERVAIPRKASPRLAVPKGSVGLAGKQTGIYPSASPGGWQIIGRTAVEMFTRDSRNPSFLLAGDTVRFTRES